MEINKTIQKNSNNIKLCYIKKAYYTFSTSSDM